MDPVTALSLAYAIIKLIMLVMDYLHAHPQIGQDVKDAIHAATGHLTDALTQLAPVQEFRLEAP